MGAEGPLEQGNSDASLTAQARAGAQADAHSTYAPHDSTEHTHPCSPVSHNALDTLCTPLSHCILACNRYTLKHSIQHPGHVALETHHVHSRLNHTHKPPQHTLQTQNTINQVDT